MAQGELELCRWDEPLCSDPNTGARLNHTTYFKLYGKTPEQIWFTLRRALEEGEEEIGKCRGNPAKRSISPTLTWSC